MKVLISCDIADEFREKTGIETVSLMPYSKLSQPVSSHADMLFCILDKTVFCYEDYVCQNNLAEILRKSGLNVVFVSNVCDCKYPKDISLNVLVIGNMIFCNARHTSVEILEYATQNNYKIIDVKQGYSACSTLVLDEKNAVTSDFGMANALKKEGINVLFLDNKDIILSGYNCGFIGGASGKIEDKIYVFGDVEMLDRTQDFKTLNNCLNNQIISILSGRVYDFGGFKLI